MADKDFIVKNGIVVNTGFAANSSQFTLSTINSTSSGILANSTVITIGNSSVSVTINSTSFSGNAATLAGDTLATIKGYVTSNASAAYTNATTFSANATNLTNGTIPYARIPANVVNTTSDFTITGTTTYNNNVIIGATSGLSANGSYGNSGQALLSNGSAVYWATATAGSNTFIQFNDSGNAGANASFTYNKISNTLTIGNSTVNATVNSTSFSGSAAYVGGNTAATLRTYSDDKAANAYANAAVFANTVANAAYANAVSYAGSIAATAYSNSVVFANTVANAAYANAVSYVNSNPGNYANSSNSKGINGTATTATNLSGGSVSATSGYFSSGVESFNTTGGYAVRVVANTAGSAQLQFTNNARNAQWGVVYADASYLYMFGTNGERLGSLGVGTNPSGSGGEIRATGDITSAYSDERLKTKMSPITDALAKVKSLNGFIYQPNQLAIDLGFADKIENRVGVSAQEVQNVLPEAVSPAPKDEEYLTVQYEKLVPLLIEAIKELSAKLEGKCSNCSCGGK